MLPLQSDRAPRLFVVCVKDCSHMVVQELDRFLDDPGDEGVVRGLGDSSVEGHILFRGDHVAGRREEYGQPVEILEGSPPGGQPSCLDFHSAPHLHQLDDSLSPRSKK